MKSFGIWYKCKGNINKKGELHINLWNLNIKSANPFIDFGFMIYDFEEVESIRFFFPFKLDEDEFIDLYDQIRNEKIARLIFNDNSCDTGSSGHHHYIKNKNTGVNISLLSLKRGDGTIKNGVDLIPEGDKGTVLEINLDEMDTAVNFKDLYFRFRIKSEELKNMLFCTLKKKNWYLESGFTSLGIVDLKVNKERNIDSDICGRQKKDHFQFMQFDKIHFFIMNPAQDDVIDLDADLLDCRILENEWKGYINSDDKYLDAEKVIAYHWKSKSDGKDMIKEYGKLVKIVSAKSNIIVIAIYILVVVLLGALGSWVSNIFPVF